MLHLAPRLPSRLRVESLEVRSYPSASADLLYGLIAIEDTATAGPDSVALTAGDHGPIGGERIALDEPKAGFDTLIDLEADFRRSADGTTQSLGNNPLESSLIEQTNRERAKAGQPPLRASGQLNAAAALQATNLIELAARTGNQNLIQHEVPGSATPTLASRVAAVGYGSEFVGENLAAGYGIDGQVVRMWLDSAIHRSNVLHPEFDEIGFAARVGPEGRTYFVQVFGRAESGSVTPPTGGAEPRFAVGSGAGPAPSLGLFGGDGRQVANFRPFGPTATGGVRVAMADVNGDGIDDVIAGTGPGGPSELVVYDGRDGRELARLAPFEESFRGGIHLAAGDVNGDGFADIVVSPDEGGGPRVRVLSGKDFSVVADFFGIDDPNFRGGVRVALGDLNGDGRADLMVGAGFGGGPRVAGYDGASLTGGTPRKLFDDFFVFEPELRNGVFLAVGDLDGDGRADLAIGAGPGGGPRVFALEGRDLLAGRRTPLANFFAGDPSDRDGVRLAARDLNGDGRAELIAAVASQVGVFSREGERLRNASADLGVLGGVFVG